MTPVRLLSLTVGDQAAIVQSQHVFLLAKNSKIKLIEEYVSLTSTACFTNVVVGVALAEEAHFEHYKMQTENANTTHIGNTFIHQEKNSSAFCMNVSTGALFARDELTIYLQGQGAECRTNGFYHLTRANQYVDHHVDIEHRAPHSYSEMLYKGVLNNKTRAVFNGRLLVENEAQKTLAYQANHTILLSKDAEMYSKPELEIYADDVKCKHGASTGQIDQDALFYLRARGISEKEAMQLLLQGFAEEVLERISDSSIKKQVQERLL
jgi:Fe-S cluster assembly protein SufD